MDENTEDEMGEEEHKVDSKVRLVDIYDGQHRNSVCVKYPYDLAHN